MPRTAARATIAAVLGASVLGLVSCGGDEPDEPVDFTVGEATERIVDGADEAIEPDGEFAAEDAPQADEPVAPGGGIDDPTLDEYVAADTQYGTFEMTTLDADGQVQYEQRGELWVDGGRFRYDLYDDGRLLRTIMTPDGQDVYFVDHDALEATPAVAVVESYLRRFRPPPVDAVEDGVDEATGAVRMRYPVQETYRVEGATNAWYAEDVTFLVADGVVIGIVSRGAAPGADDAPPPLRTVRMLFASLKVGAPTPPGTFDLVYPVVPSS